jgi:hypothetical protein
MAKTLKTPEELITLLNAELRKHEFCEGVSVTEIVPVKDERLHFTWTALIQHGARLPQYEDCSRFFLAALHLFQQHFDLRRDDKKPSTH